MTFLRMSFSEIGLDHDGILTTNLDCPEIGQAETEISEN